jgi:hypothetical protein
MLRPKTYVGIGGQVIYKVMPAQYLGQVALSSKSPDQFESRLSLGTSREGCLTRG